MSSLSRVVLSTRAVAPSSLSRLHSPSSSSIFTPSSSPSLLSTRSFSSSSPSSEKLPAAETSPAFMNEFHSLRESKGFLGAIQIFYEKYGGRLVENNFQGEKEVWLFNPKDVQKVVEAEGEYPSVPTDAYNHFAKMMEKQNVTSPFMGGCPHKWKATRQALEKDLSKESVQFYYKYLYGTAQDACDALRPDVKIEGLDKKKDPEEYKNPEHEFTPVGLRPVDERDYLDDVPPSKENEPTYPFTPAIPPKQYLCSNFPSFLLTVAHDLSLSVSLGYNPQTTHELRQHSELEGWKSGYDIFRHPVTMLTMENEFFPEAEEGEEGEVKVTKDEWVEKEVARLMEKGFGEKKKVEEGEGKEEEDSDGGLSSFEYFDENPAKKDDKSWEEEGNLSDVSDEKERELRTMDRVLGKMKEAVGGVEGEDSDLDPHTVDLPHTQDFSFLQNLSSISSMAALMAQDPFNHTGADKLAVYFENVMKRSRFMVREINNMMRAGRVTEACSLTPHAPLIFRLLHRGDLTVEEVEENFVHLLLAGVDSTRHVLSWIVLHIANNPEVQAKLSKELEEVIGNGPLLPSHSSKLPYLHSVIRESHRLTPPSSFTTYRTMETDVALEGYEIPKDTKVVFAMNPIQNDSSLIDEPSQFNPDRWSEEAVSSRKGTEKEVIDHPYLEKPYGFGGRKCAGAHLADAQVECFVAALVRDYKIGFSSQYKCPIAEPEERAEEDRGVKRGENGEMLFPMVQEMYLRADPYPDLVFTPRK